MMCKEHMAALCCPLFLDHNDTLTRGIGEEKGLIRAGGDDMRATYKEDF